MSNITEAYSRRIRDLRRGRKWSQQELARRADVTLSSYKRFEHSGEISLERFVRILRILGREQELSELLSRPDLPQTPEQVRKALQTR